MPVTYIYLFLHKESVANIKNKIKIFVKTIINISGIMQNYLHLWLLKMRGCRRKPNLTDSTKLTGSYFSVSFPWLFSEIEITLIIKKKWYNILLRKLVTLTTIQVPELNSWPLLLGTSTGTNRFAEIIREIIEFLCVQQWKKWV